IKSEKNKILAGKLEDLIAGQNNQFYNKLDALSKAVKTKIKQLDSVDSKQLEQRAQLIKNGLSQASAEVKQVFTELSFGIEEDINKLINLINDRSFAYLGVRVEAKSREESYRVKIGTESASSWYNPFSWGDKKNIYETRHRTINYNVANAIDAAENASMFVRLINNEIAEAWSEIVDVQAAEKELIRAALKGFDLEDENFDKNLIINPTKNALRAIQIKPLQLRDKEYRDAIANSFSSSEIEDSGIEKLKSKVREIIYKICEDIRLELENTLHEIKATLQAKGDGFIDSIKEQSQKEVSAILEDLKNIEDAKKRYEKTIADVTSFQNNFGEVK
ncbi:MAG TPA: hypothetical protein PLV58_12725, partial [Campylobacterales bacterium]|nr:hypothetical protein [Campylobacterales bacterium]